MLANISASRSLVSVLLKGFAISFFVAGFVANDKAVGSRLWLFDNFIGCRGNATNFSHLMDIF
jgi:hypothetical protein